MVICDAHVFPGFLTPVLTVLSFQSHRLLFSHALAEVRGENTPERKFASTGYRSHNHQGHESDTLTTEPPGWANFFLNRCKRKFYSNNVNPLPLDYSELKKNCRRQIRYGRNNGMCIKKDKEDCGKRRKCWLPA